MTTPDHWLLLDEGDAEALATAIANELNSRHDAYNLAAYSDADLLTLLDNLQGKPGAFMPDLPAALTPPPAESEQEDPADAPETAPVPPESDMAEQTPLVFEFGGLRIAIIGACRICLTPFRIPLGVAAA